ncbi:hypothetical protein QYE76_056320 [Lolium multiflorum]|uniref:Reverse transcriptase domain-containing protein n=1 Tax=Lolium multiflorum TaxID=4521 RepID=A0AAD8T1E7_LOLMU|nr:hypothetical protein QYE76_056320 [Lolium multiflorum]
MKVEPRLTRLLARAGITLRRNNRLPPPPSICEEWWRQSEVLDSTGGKKQPKYGLGYVNLHASDPHGNEHDGNSRAACHATSVSSGDDADVPYQPLHQQNSTDGEHPEPDGDLGASPAPQELEDGGQPTIDELVEVNLGTEEDPRPTFVSAILTEEEREGYRSFLMEYQDCFAWSYKEMPGLDPRIATHKLAIDPQFRPVKQKPRHLRPEFQDSVIAEVDKLITAGFIKEAQYTEWLSSIVPVEKKNGQVRVCQDFRDLNRACPKDDFPIPITEIIVDSTTGHGALSFMDGSSGYNQIKMDPDDAIHTAFRTPKGNFYYTIMPFGLKNAGATYQRAMTRVLGDLFHHKVECYIDDLVVKTKDRRDHKEDLRVVFERLRRHQLRMNPLKCAFAVQSGVFLGFVVRHRGIEVEPKKIKAIPDMPAPQNLKELRTLQGKLAYIRRFISNLSGCIQPFSHLVKKGAPFVWDESCQRGFDDIKSVSAIPYELYTEIMHEIDSCELEDIDVVIQLANRETISPIGIVRDVEVLCDRKGADNPVADNLSRLENIAYDPVPVNDSFPNEQLAVIKDLFQFRGTMVSKNKGKELPDEDNQDREWKEEDKSVKEEAKEDEEEVEEVPQEHPRTTIASIEVVTNSLNAKKSSRIRTGGGLPRHYLAPRTSSSGIHHPFHNLIYNNQIERTPRQHCLAIGI